LLRLLFLLSAFAAYLHSLPISIGRLPSLAACLTSAAVGALAAASLGAGHPIRFLDPLTHRSPSLILASPASPLTSFPLASGGPGAITNHRESRVQTPRVPRSRTLSCGFVHTKICTYLVSPNRLASQPLASQPPCPPTALSPRPPSFLSHRASSINAPPLSHPASLNHRASPSATAPLSVTPFPSHLTSSAAIPAPAAPPKLSELESLQSWQVWVLW
jgi:hypothetical protein